jgi:hypothetical protein
LLVDDILEIFCIWAVVICTGVPDTGSSFDRAIEAPRLGLPVDPTRLPCPTQSMKTVLSKSAVVVAHAIGGVGVVTPDSTTIE